MFSYCDVFGMVSVNTTKATPGDMQPLGGWTLQILAFALGPKKFEIGGCLAKIENVKDFTRIFWVFNNFMIHGFRDTWFLPGTKK